MKAVLNGIPARARKEGWIASLRTLRLNLVTYGPRRHEEFKCG